VADPRCNKQRHQQEKNADRQGNLVANEQLPAIDATANTLKNFTS
jgi:hypothetical protein